MRQDDHMREYDLVLYGASGFVGALTAQYLRQAAPPDARIALAGRSLARVEQVREESGRPEWGVIVADAGDPHSLAALAARTRVVATTVGPYARYGLPLVGACAEAGTHYADLTGEPLFVREAIDRYHDLACSTGARIVTSCGFDSVPSDLSVYLLYRATVDDNTGELADTTLVAHMRGGASGGTIASGRAQFEAVAAERSAMRVLAHPYSLSPDQARDPDVGRQNDQAFGRAADIDPSLTGWVTTFLMAGHNTKIVRRTNGLLGWPYGKNFRYREVQRIGNPAIAAAIAAALPAMAVAGVGLSRIGLGRKLLDRVLPAPGTGPDEKARTSGWFKMLTFARTTSGARYRATFAAQGDPGYAATAVMLGESALTLAYDSLTDTTGITTPAAVMAEPLAARLRTAGFTIGTERL
jgi:short subunit dehydrogenase-like uncharacterized protein